MSGGIPLDWLVQVNSTGVSDRFSLSKLPTILITKYNANLPVGKWNTYYNASSVTSSFGSGTQSTFASNYFGFTSKKSTKADLLNIYVWNNQATPSCLIGGVANSIDTLKTLNGSFSITIGDTTKDIEVNLTTANSYTDCATIIQTAIQGIGSPDDFQNASVIYSPQTKGFIIKSGVSGASSLISYISSPTSGTDISGSLSLQEAQGAYIISGQDLIGSFEGVLNEIQSRNGAYFVITTDFAFDNEELDLQTFGSFIQNSNNRFLGLYISQNKNLINTNTATATYNSYNGLMLEYQVNQNQLGLSAGIISAIDFSQENGNYNIAFNDASAFAANAITSETQLNNLEGNLCNSILKFGKMGQFDTWYGMGNIFGTLTNSANVYIANAYLTMQLQFQVANMFASQGMIGLRGSNNEGIIRSYLDSVFSGCVNAGIIVEGAKLTTTEEQTITSSFSSNADTAINQLQRSGYFYQITSVDLANKTITITSAYVANTPAKKLIINNYILGA